VAYKKGENLPAFISHIDISTNICVMYVYQVIRSVYFTHTLHQGFKLFFARSV